MSWEENEKPEKKGKNSLKKDEIKQIDTNISFLKCTIDLFVDFIENNYSDTNYYGSCVLSFKYGVSINVGFKSVDSGHIVIMSVNGINKNGDPVCVESTGIFTKDGYHERNEQGKCVFSNLCAMNLDFIVISELQIMSDKISEKNEKYRKSGAMKFFNEIMGKERFSDTKKKAMELAKKIYSSSSSSSSSAIEEESSESESSCNPYDGLSVEELDAIQKTNPCIMKCRENCKNCCKMMSSSSAEVCADTILKPFEEKRGFWSSAIESIFSVFSKILNRIFLIDKCK